MRKGQSRILEKALKNGFSKEQIDKLSDETLIIGELNALYWYFWDTNRKNILPEYSIKEWEYVNSLIKKYNISKNDHHRIRDILLDNYPNCLNRDTRKEKIVKLFLFLNGHHMQWRCTRVYATGLFYNLPAWNILQPIKALLKIEEDDYGFCGWDETENYLCLIKNESMRDDYIHNQISSFIYKLIASGKQIETDAISDLERLYDIQRHSFKCDIFNFLRISLFNNEKYVINASAYKEYIFQSNAMLSHIYQICKERMYMLTSGGYSIRWWEDDNMEAKLRQAAQIVTPIKVDAPAETIYIELSKKGYITVTNRHYSETTAEIKNNDELHISLKPIGNPTIFLITPQGLLFQKNAKGKYYPMSLKKVRLFLNKPVIGEILKCVLNASNNLFVKDVFTDIKSICLVPASYNEILQYHNRAEFINSKYKAAQNIHIKWNKLNLNFSYMILAALPLVKDEFSRNILLEQRDVSLTALISEYDKKGNKAITFLSNIIYKKIEGENKGIRDELWVKINDYVRMCTYHKESVRLDIKTREQIENKHDEISLFEYEKKTKKVKVPAHSVFLPLRKILPKDFEWIKTRKRLVLESGMQRHCVWSYADYITADKCAIYSFVDKTGEYGDDGRPNRYTIEFQESKGKYFIRQIQGKFNRINTRKMHDYVQSILYEKSNNKKEKKKHG